MIRAHGAFVAVATLFVMSSLLAQPIKMVRPAHGAKSTAKVYVQAQADVPTAQLWLNDTKACDSLPCQFAAPHGIYHIKAVLTHFDPPHEGRRAKIMVKAGLRTHMSVGPTQKQRTSIHVQMTDQPLDMAQLIAPPEKAKTTKVDPPPAETSAPSGPAKFIDVAPSAGKKGAEKVRVQVLSKIASVKTYINDVLACTQAPCHFDTYQGIYHVKVVLTHYSPHYEARKSKQMVKVGRKSIGRFGPSSSDRHEVRLEYVAVP